MNLHVPGKVFLFCAVVTGILKILSLVIPAHNLVYGFTGAVLIIAVTLIFLKGDQKTVRDIEFKFDSKTVTKFFAGFIIGVITISLLVLLISCMSDSSIQLNPNSNPTFVIITGLPSTFFLALTEEVGFRGYPLITLKNNYNIWIATIVTSILFGLYHVAFGWGLIGFCSTTIWGLLFSNLAIRSNGISIPAGFHTGINFAQLTLGLANSSFSIWIVNGLHSEQFVVAFIVTPLVFYLITLKSISKRREKKVTRANNEL